MNPPPTPIEIREGRAEDAAVIAEYNQRMALETEAKELGMSHAGYHVYEREF